MKRFAVILTVTVLCLYSSNEVGLAQEKHHEMKTKSKDDSSHAQHGKKGSTVVKTVADTGSAQRSTDPKLAASINGIVDSYLKVKNSLADDKAKNAADAGKELVEALGRLDTSLLTAEQAKLYEDVEGDAKEQAEHIGENAGNMAHQREHFEMLSKDIYDLVKAFGSGQVLYKDFCAMYNDKKGAMWLSETKTIKNPYYGKKMLTCGSVQEEIR